MDYIILDIEFNGRKFPSPLPMEVIEIGAVRVDGNLEVIDQFTSLIKPVYFSKLNSFIQQKTGIPQEEIDTAHSFPTVINSFKQWLSERPFSMLVTWGGEDMKRIVLDTQMHKMDDQYWLNTPYFDLLKGYTRFIKVKNDVSVEKALEQLNLISSGTAHRALNDAFMTAQIFKKIYHELDFDKKQYYTHSFTNAKERRSIKNVVRILRMKNEEPTWELFVEKFVSEKFDMNNENKINEIKQHFLQELKKPVARSKQMNRSAEKHDETDVSANDSDNA